MVEDNLASRVFIVVQFGKLASFYAFLAWEWLQKSVLTMFVEYQEKVSLNQLDVLRDCYQKVERKHLKLVQWSITVITGFALVGSVFAFFDIVPYLVLLEINNVAQATILLLLIKILGSTYLSFFRVLFMRRKYEFTQVHGPREVPLALITIICLMFLFLFAMFWCLSQGFWMGTYINSLACAKEFTNDECKDMIEGYWDPNSRIEQF